MESELLARNEPDMVWEEDAALAAVARSDPAAFSRLYHRYVTPIYRYLYRWVGNPAEAEDLTSQVFIAVLEGLEHYRERGSFTAWLFTIARRTAISAYRKRKPAVSIEEAENLSGLAEDPLDQVIRAERIGRMEALLAGLDTDKRDLLRLRFTAGLSYAEIGAMLGRSEAAAKMAIYRVLRQLYEQWEKQA